MTSPGKAASDVTSTFEDRLADINLFCFLFLRPLKSRDVQRPDHVAERCQDAGQSEHRHHPLRQ